MHNNHIIMGRVKRGLRLASGLGEPVRGPRLINTIEKQRCFFEEIVPGMEYFYNGTINLDISPLEFRILKQDFEIKCKWEENIEETFWFVESKLQFKKKKYDGMIYYPCPSETKEYSKNNMFEIIAPFIEYLKYGDKLYIQYNDSKILIK
jgi:hypothetical protein